MFFFAFHVAAICVEREKRETKCFVIGMRVVIRKKRKLITSSALGPRRSQVIRVITWAGPVRPCVMHNRTRSVCRKKNGSIENVTSVRVDVFSERKNRNVG